MNLPSLKHAATDLTLFFGAESFIDQCRGERIFDPDGEHCLAALIDLIVNCESLGLTFPGSDSGNPSKLIPLLEEYFVKLPGGIEFELSAKTEDEIVAAFVAHAKSREWRWFNRWLTFQLTSPIVTNGHSVRLKHDVLSPGARQAWPAKAGLIKEQLRWPAFQVARHLPPYMELICKGLNATTLSFAMHLTFTDEAGSTLNV